MSFVIIFNAPPLSGKDYLSDQLYNNFSQLYFYKSVTNKPYRVQFKSKIFELTKCLYSITDDQWDNLYQRENKEKPSPLLGGLSPRMALIHVSEDIIKPNFGDDYFGQQVRKIIDRDNNGVYFVSDGGFPSELLPLKDPEIQGCIVQLYNGCDTFNGDSRSYIHQQDLNVLGLSNFEIMPYYHNKTDESANVLEELIYDKIIEYNNCYVQ